MRWSKWINKCEVDGVEWSGVWSMWWSEVEYVVE